MEAYTGFAEVYDTFMDETPYHDWASYISSLIIQYGITRPSTPGLDREDDALSQEKAMVVELGCGTGSFTEEMAVLGYDMTGIDNSSEMLQIAMRRREETGSDILYLEQDMREIELYSTAGTFVSVCDSMNYLTDPQDIVKTLRLVNNYLYPSGIFIFDFNTVHKYRDTIGNTTIAEDRDNTAFIWDNWYDETSHINEYDLTIFVQQEGDLYRRFTETHYQRGYTLEEMEKLVAESGMELITSIDADTHEPPNDNSERIYIIARKNTENNTIVK